MDFFSVLTMFGGLALFLYGMNAMGEGLEKVSGGRLEKILEKLTSTPIKGVLLGAGVTGIIQSSSATTVMVVGFVNSGIMKLSQVISIIMGANIGTTVTSWILSLSGIESDNFVVKLLKPTSFSPILALVGVIFLLFSKKEKKKDIGTILIGFAILMFGMETMSNAVKPLANVPEFTNVMTMFSNPVLGMMMGAVLTAIIQSSSASVGILQALCVTGSLSYGVALPVIMGQNIGTCITAILSSVGANKNAKRAALIHLYFNLIGTVIFMSVFYTINIFLKFPFLQDNASQVGIAIIHSTFNIGAVILLLPFAKWLEKLAYLTIKDEKDTIEVNVQEKVTILDSRFLEKPSFAIEQSKNAAVKMAQLSKDALFESISLFESFDEKRAEEVCQLEDQVDAYEDELGSYLIKLSRKKLSEKDSHTLSMLLHCIGDFERISDHAINLMKVAKEINQKKMKFSQEAKRELRIFTNAIQEIVLESLEVFEKEDIQLAAMIEPLEEVIDDLNAELKKKHIKRLRTGECTIELGILLSDITTNYERVADHCSNVAVCLIQVNEDGFDTHKYLDIIKREDNQSFRENYVKMKEKYSLS